MITLNIRFNLELLSVYISICLSAYLSIYLSFYLSICLSVYLSIFLSVYLSISLSVYLSISVSVYCSICVSAHFYLSHLILPKPITDRLYYLYLLTFFKYVFIPSFCLSVYQSIRLVLYISLSFYLRFLLNLFQRVQISALLFSPFCTD